MMAKFNFIDELFDLIMERKAHALEGSYTNRLLDAGVSKIAQKVGEESVEVVIAALSQSDQRMVEELADLVYHCLVLMAAKNLTPDMVRAELEKRHWPRE
jgi:phosphoribosyl-ATP pyrophosphohydrolase/phosphoribosyl-AMP cyclohydrolase